MVRAGDTQTLQVYSVLWGVWHSGRRRGGGTRAGQNKTFQAQGHPCRGLVWLLGWGCVQRPEVLRVTGPG